MVRLITGPTVAPLPLQFDPIGGDATFPRIARLPGQRPAHGEFGTLLRCVELAASALTATAYRPALRLQPHAHTSAFLLFVRDGAFVENHGRQSERCDRFTCIFRPAYDEHTNEFDDRGAILAAIDVSPAWIARLRDAGFRGDRMQFRSPFVAHFAGRLDAELAWPDSMSEVVIESLAIDVIACASRVRPRNDRGRAVWLERAQQMIEEEFASPLSLTQIAEAVGVHPVHLARQFRAVHRCTVGEYIRRVRVAFARRELAMTDRAIVEIALGAGFCDQSQLTKTFKRITGSTPGAYRSRRR